MSQVVARASQGDVVIPRVGPQLETMHAAYAKACLPHIEARLLAGQLKIVEAGLKPRIDFQNVDTDGAEAFAAHGGREVPALWDGARLHQGSYDVRLALGAIIAAEG